MGVLLLIVVAIYGFAQDWREIRAHEREVDARHRAIAARHDGA
jgi:hypothetical protein